MFDIFSSTTMLASKQAISSLCDEPTIAFIGTNAFLIRSVAYLRCYQGDRVFFTSRVFSSTEHCRVPDPTTYNFFCLRMCLEESEF